mmetsp:Transcript_156/g.463  ORF Transcript_156/g.463 Transcript_156/m.463 type:complete len:197 (+) Transcript_156:78-668(+)
MSQARAAILGAGAGAAASLLLLRLWSTSADESWDDVSVDSDGESEDEADASQQPPAVVRDDYSSTDAPYKMLLIFNMELYKLSSKTGEMKTVKMSPGKAAAQSGHATLGAYRRALRLCPNAVRDWLRIGQMKITVKCPTVAELLELERRCIAAGLNCCLIRDAGHTEIEPGSRTVLAVGPAPASALDPITRHLKPY